MIDALRDVAVNAVWHLTHQIGSDSFLVMKALFGFVEIVNDTALLATLGKMKIHPAAWASWLVRVEAITDAKKSVRMSVERLVYSDLVGQDQ